MTTYILLFIVGSNISPNRFESMAAIQQEFASKQACEVALGNLLKQVYKKTDVVAATCTSKN